MNSFFFYHCRCSIKRYQYTTNNIQYAIQLHFWYTEC